jgi:beta-phosphoglucomutase-like phosphatase (HAD superfamily)
MADAVVDLADLLAPSRCILLDFDGPICGLFRGHLTGAAVVERLATVMIESGLCPIEWIPQTEDGLELLKLAHDIDPRLATRVENVLTQAETEAARTARPTPHAAGFIQGAVASGRAIAIVSNNSASAIETYLAIHSLVVDAVIGRADADPAHLKPSPYLLDCALKRMHSTPAGCTLIGDSWTDIEAARSAAMSSIGYADSQAKEATLLAAGADLVIDDIYTLTAALPTLGTT